MFMAMSFYNFRMTFMFQADIIGAKLNGTCTR